MDKRGDARVVTHSSGARNRPFNPLMRKYFEQNGGNLGGNASSLIFSAPRWTRYQQSKLANCVFILALRDLYVLQTPAQQFQENDARLNASIQFLCAHPGVAITSLMDTTHKNGGAGISQVNK